MATITLNSTARFAPAAWVQNAKQSVVDAWQRRAVYNNVMAELRALNDRELADIGVVRGDFSKIAAEAAAKV